MSIIVAIIGKVGIVASDSQRVENNGQVTPDFDKTFKIKSPSLIGGFVGLLEFSGSTISQHVEQILANSTLRTFKDAVELIGGQIRKRLLVIPESDIGFAHRKVDFLLVGKSELNKGRLEIRSVDIRADTSKSDILLKYGYYPNVGAYAHSGNTSARNAAKKRLRKNAFKFQMMTACELEAEADKVIRIAIKHTGPHPHFPHIPACGGVVKTKTIS
jgi:hypothetical protein